MAQEKIKMNNIVIAQPDELGYAFETTYTEDSGRVQTGKAEADPMFTVDRLSFGYKFLTMEEAGTILQIIGKGEPFSMRYPSIYHKRWRTAKFYVGQGNINNCGRFNLDEGLVEGLSFNAAEVDPL